MPQLEFYSLIKWLHLLALALAGGSAMVILVLVGFEDSREDLKGLTSLLWKRTTAWAFRIAVLLGIVLVVLQQRSGAQPFAFTYLHYKLVLVFLLLMCSEMSGKALARARRGTALLAFVFFLLATFVAVNKDAFAVVKPHRLAPGAYTGAVEQGTGN
jgi:uncharacterized membrane protein